MFDFSATDNFWSQLSPSGNTINIPTIASAAAAAGGDNNDNIDENDLINNFLEETRTTTTTTTTTASLFTAQDLMTFAQTWTDATTGGSGVDGGADDFSSSAAAAHQAPPLDFNNFSFDPSLIESIPDNIPDFFLAFVDTTSPLFGGGHQQHHHQQQLSTAPQDPHLLSAPSHSFASSPSDASPHAHGAGITPGDAATTIPSSSSSTTTTHTGTTHVAGAGRGSLVIRSPPTSGGGGGGGGAGDDPDVVLKRQRNTIAARKYRQKRLDRIKELEDALEAMTRERDELRLKLARQEAETAALKEMMQMGKGSGGKEN